MNNIAWHNVTIFFALILIRTVSSCGIKKSPDITPQSHDITSPSNSLHDLLDDFKHYKTTSKHLGDLYEHSMWIEQYLSYPEDTISYDDTLPPLDCFWEKRLNTRDLYILALAGLLHDIGKAGDTNLAKYKSYEKRGNDIYYFSKENHERIGFEYILHDIKDPQKYQGYLKVDNTPLDFKKIFDALSISHEEQKIIAVLIGMHKDFPNVLSGKITKEYMIKHLKDLAAEAGLALQKKYITMIIAISIADALSTCFAQTKEVPSLVFKSFIFCKAPHIHEKDTPKLRLEFMMLTDIFNKTKDSLITYFEKGLE